MKWWKAECGLYISEKTAGSQLELFSSACEIQLANNRQRDFHVPKNKVR